MIFTGVSLFLCLTDVIQWFNVSLDTARRVPTPAVETLTCVMSVN